MRIRYIHATAIDLGGSIGHVEKGRVIDVAPLVAYRLLHDGRAEEVGPDPVAEPMRTAEPPKRRTR